MKIFIWKHRRIRYRWCDPLAVRFPYQSDFSYENIDESDTDDDDESDIDDVTHWLTLDETFVGLTTVRLGHNW